MRRTRRKGKMGEEDELDQEGDGGVEDGVLVGISKLRLNRKLSCEKVKSRVTASIVMSSHLLQHLHR